MKKGKLAPKSAVVVFFIEFLIASVVNAQTYYVSLNGADTNPGTVSSPFKTITRARDVIHASGQHGATVYIRAGTYELSAPIEFTAQDSGVSGLPNTYVAYPGESVTISGGTRIQGGWSLYSGSIYRINVGTNRFRSLFVNGRRATRARELEDGSFYLIKSIDSNSVLRAFRFTAPNIVNSWTNLTDVEVVSYRTWHQSRHRISNVTGDKVTFDASQPSGYGYNTDYVTTTGRYYVENVFEGLDTPGEWYLNNSTGYLYYWPLAAESINSLEFTYPNINSLIHLSSTQYVNFENLTFAYTDWPFPAAGWSGTWGGYMDDFTINYEAAQHCAITNCVVAHTGLGGIGATYGQFLNITGNQIYDTGAGGIVINAGSGNIHALTGNWVVSYNTVHDIGVIYKESHAILMDGIGQIISHNLVYNAPYIGISLQTVYWREDVGDPNFLYWKPNILSCNEVHHVMQELNDGAGIYVSGQQPGSLIINNFIHDTMFTDMHLYRTSKYGGQLDGLYLDDGAKGFIARDNIVCRAETGLLVHDSVNNLIANNVFIDSNSYDLIFSGYTLDESGASRDWAQPGNTFTQNIIYSTKSAEKLATVYTENGINNVASSDYNLFYTTHPANSNWNLATWKSTYNFESHSFTSDPLFADYAHDNFNLLPESPAFGLGFVQINRNGDFADLSGLLSGWLQTSSVANTAAPPGGKGILNFVDFALFSQYWLEGVGQ